MLRLILPLRRCLLLPYYYYHESNSTLQAPILGLVQIDRFFTRSGEASEGNTLAIPSNYIEQDPLDSENPACETVSSTIEVYVREDSNWGAGYCNTVTVTNMSDEEIEWEITLEVPGTISNCWNAVNTDIGDGQVNFVGSGWNSFLAPNQSAEFGFCAEL